MCAGHGIRMEKHEFFIELNVRIDSHSSMCQSKILVWAEGFSKEAESDGYPRKSIWDQPWEGQFVGSSVSQNEVVSQVISLCQSSARLLATGHRSSTGPPQSVWKQEKTQVTSAKIKGWRSCGAKCKSFSICARGAPVDIMQLHPNKTVFTKAGGD